MPSTNSHTDETIVDSMCESVTIEFYVQFCVVIHKLVFFSTKVLLKSLQLCLSCTPKLV